MADREAWDENGRTAFLMACVRGSTECIGVLAEAGCDKDAVADDRKTALMLAAESGDSGGGCNAAAVRAVLSLGVADIEKKRCGTSTAARRSHWPVMQKGWTECIGVLAEAGYNKDVVEDNGGTALMLAAHSGEAAAVRAVLDLGVADREVRDQAGATAFLVACQKRSAECISVLAEAGCDTAATLPAPDGHGSRRWGARDCSSCSRSSGASGRYRQ